MPVVSHKLWAATVAAALALAAVATYALTQDDDEGAGRPAAKALPPVEVETGVVHVHGLGVDPGDGTLYAATHSGLFRLPENGKAIRVANRAQDTMGFSVVGPGRFIGSGHPDFREDDLRPPLLGLIESTDAGESWEPLSLRGQADFHTLQAVHGQVFGYDSTSGTFMVSRDRRQWEQRAQLRMRDFVVSPSSPDVVLATTQQGLVGSVDGGRTWQPKPSAPALVVMAWSQQSSVFGVTPEGVVQHSADGGGTWTARGRVGAEPEALAVVVRDGRETMYVAASGRGILASSDGGRVFTQRYAE